MVVWQRKPHPSASRTVGLCGATKQKKAGLKGGRDLKQLVLESGYNEGDALRSSVR